MALGQGCEPFDMPADPVHGKRDQMSDQPILAVDVDGVVNAMSRGVPPAGWRDVKVRAGYGDYGYPPRLRIRHNPSHGARLLQDFHFEQAWQWLTMVKEKRGASHE